MLAVDSWCDQDLKKQTKATMSSELYQQTMFDNSSISSRAREPQLQPFMFSASPFPPAVPDSATESVSCRAFQPFFRDQQLEAQFQPETTNDYTETSAHMEDEYESACQQEDGSTVSPMTAPLYGVTVGSSEPSSLDRRIGTNTADMYSRMREVQLKHSPNYQPNSPYIKYRRLVDILGDRSS
jgi:hypothetical protein